MREEAVNAWTHGAGLVLSLAALPVLVVIAVNSGGAYRITSFAIYGAALVILYLASTVYHAVRRPDIKGAFRRLDHAAIFLLIAGTYTPFTLLNMQGPWGWALFGVVWGCAIAGVAFKLCCRRGFMAVTTALYIVMGWSVLIAVKPALASIHPHGIAWLVAGGLAYTGGVVFFALNRIPYNHAIWHIFVLAGSICHFLAVVLYAGYPQGS